MSVDSTSLDRLHDLVVPEPALWWPPAPGWYWLLGILALFLLVSLLRGFHRWQHNRYRREALAELTRLESLIANVDKNETGRNDTGRNSARRDSTEQNDAGGKSAGRNNQALLGMAEVLKRTALTAFPRTQVAQLTGREWFDFLDRTGGTGFGTGIGQLFEQAIYQSRTVTLSDAQNRATLNEIRNWVRNHQVC